MSCVYYNALSIDISQRKFLINVADTDESFDAQKQSIKSLFSPLDGADSSLSGHLIRRDMAGEKGGKQQQYILTHRNSIL